MALEKKKNFAKMWPAQMPEPHYRGPNLCASLTQLQLFTYIIETFIYKLNIKQFRDVPATRNHNEYDFVVVGGGTAGAVVAARLSEMRSPIPPRVLLIEGGPEEPLNAMVPSMVANYIGSELDWKYKTSNEPNACLSKNGTCNWPRGKNLGGCSVHNGMMYMRGNPKDYNDWNIPGWSYEEVLPLFKKSEKNLEYANSYHGNSGPLPVGRFPWQPPIAQDILKATSEAGYKVVQDLNGQDTTGFTIAQTMSYKGVRVSTATAYLRPIRDRPNLTVMLNATVTKILFEKDYSTGVPMAVGVQFQKNGKTHTVRAKKEVVLSAGAVGSPHILLLSGVGPKEQLNAKGVKVVHDLPGVGENLQNHVSFEVPFSVNDNDTDVFTDAVLRYMYNQTGPLASTGLSQMTGIVATKYTTPDHPDLQFFFNGYTVTCNPASNERQKISIVPTYLHPKSRGSLKLSSNDPLSHPIIQQNYLTEKQDVDSLIEGIKIALKIGEMPALKKNGIKLELKPVTECTKKYRFMSDDYWRCAVSWNTSPENHQAGSCKMGLDSMAVVDPDLKVHGVDRLRVADASVIPKLMSGNTAAPIIMIAERVAELIREDHEPSYKSPYCHRYRSHPHNRNHLKHHIEHNFDHHFDHRFENHVQYHDRHTSYHYHY